jgi:PIN domain nuclease of toxin-antitoxin system
MSESPVLLLDTCAMIYIAGGTRLEAEASKAILQAAENVQLHVSPISAWEVGLAVARNRINTPLSAIDYFNTFLTRTGARLCGLDPEILVNATALPGVVHKDPIDRILIATARFYNHVLVTSDRAILAYGEAGHVKILAC